MQSAALVRRGGSTGLALFAVLLGCHHGGSLPVQPTYAPSSVEEGAIEGQPVCIGSTVASAGRLADVLYYRYSHLPNGDVTVGYYAFFSEERPWGNNWLTWTVLPALAIDLVYTRALLVAPGVQRLAYGKGDVEGVRIVYGVGPSGELVAKEAFSDDSVHRPVAIDRAAMFSVDPARPTFYADAWNHHLGGRGARSERDLAYRRCYSGDSIRPLTEKIASEFDLERRALPAAVGPIRSRAGSPTLIASRRPAGG
jgi:hypothetical protein